MPGLRNGSWVALLAVAASSASHASVIGVSETEFRQLYSLGPNGRVTIQNQYGNVSITGWDRDDVLVEAVKRSSDPRRLDDARIVVEPADGALLIRTQYAGPDTQHAPKVEYRILVPRNANLEDVKLGNGGLVISGVAGTVKASSVNGNIKAEKLESRAGLSTVNWQLAADFDRVGAGHPAQQLNVVHQGGPQIRLTNVNGGISIHSIWSRRTERPTI